MNPEVVDDTKGPIKPRVVFIKDARGLRCGHFFHVECLQLFASKHKEHLHETSCPGCVPLEGQAKRFSKQNSGYLREVIHIIVAIAFITGFIAAIDNI